MSARTCGGVGVVERHAERRPPGSRESASLPSRRPASGIARAAACSRPCRSYKTLPSRRTMRPAGRNRRRAPGRVSSTPCTMSSGSVPARARVDDPASTSPSESVGPGIEDVERRRPARPRPRVRSAADRLALVVATRPAQPEQPRAVDVRRVDRRHHELGARRLRLVGVVRQLTVIACGRVADQLLGEPAEQEQLFVRRVRRQQEAHAVRIRPARGRQPVAQPRCSASCHETGCCTPAASCTSGRRRRSSPSIQ